ncbi:BrnA antitoxin family protein [Xanthobacter aminoxidans]|uniref:BrnA antitoxin family protein n=1 Tax=Xanthobacter aminoxidans TaxID=186280 RepID=UPI002022BEA8|nr:BrnA antitoxin family protein [Xanthobacter aminoxidans]MCL8382473.1 BrnA antitoxin family protein [Xanthobacter aminoxidans]
MTKKPMKEFEPGHGFSKADWDAVSDNPEWTEEEIRTAKPFAEAFPDLAATIKRGRPKAKNPKELLSLRIDADVVEAFRNTGPGWQGRMNAALRKAAGLKSAS